MRVKTLYAALALSPALLAGCGGYGLTEYGDASLGDGSLFIVPEAQVRFAPTPPGREDVTEVTLVSSGDLPVRIEEIWLEGPGADDFVLPDLLMLPLELDPGLELPFTLRFLPEDPGSASATLYVGVGDLSAEVLSVGVFGRACEDGDGDGACDD